MPVSTHFIRALSRAARNASLPLLGSLLLGLLLAACGVGTEAPAPTPVQSVDTATQSATPGAAAPIATPAPATTPAPVTASPTAPVRPFADQMLEAINVARAQPRNCGTNSFAAASPLRWNAQTEEAARIQASYLQQNNLFSHSGANQNTVADRLTSTGYLWREVGENLAAGYADIASVMQAWLDSPGHCANLMHASFVEVGVALVDGIDSNTYRNYWGMVLATPR